MGLLARDQPELLPKSVVVPAVEPGNENAILNPIETHPFDLDLLPITRSTKILTFLGSSQRPAA